MVLKVVGRGASGLLESLRVELLNQKFAVLIDVVAAAVDCVGVALVLLVRQAQVELCQIFDLFQLGAESELVLVLLVDDGGQAVVVGLGWIG